MSKTYSITLKLVGEARLVDSDSADDDAVDVASIRKDFGKIGETICVSEDLEAMKPVRSRIVGVDRSTPEFMIQMLHLARDMDQGKFRGEAFAEAVKDGVLCGGSLRGTVAAEVLDQLTDMGLSVVSPVVASSKVN